MSIDEAKLDELCQHTMIEVKYLVKDALLSKAAKIEKIGKVKKAMQKLAVKLEIEMSERVIKEMLKL